MNPLAIHALSLSDSRAEFEVVGVSPSDHGALYGPLCAYARTLPTRFPIGEVEPRAAVGGSRRVVIADPCYWTPELPFLYDLVLRPEGGGCGLREIRCKVGLRRLFVANRSKRQRSGCAAFTLESRRYVFRGLRVASLEQDHIERAHLAEMALLVEGPRPETCALAAEQGAFVVADLRGARIGLDQKLADLAWHPAAALAILDSDAIDFARESKSSGLRIAQVVDAMLDVSPSALSPLVDAIIFELGAGERPPTWAASYGKPVIAIRRGVSYADFHEARGACERLQAELAPEFDLAGYFV